MMLKFNVISLFIFLIYLNVTNLEICTRIVNFTEKIRVPESYLVTKTYRTISGAIKSITRNETKFVTQSVVRTRIRKGCCQGYVRKSHRCEPVCNFVCENSICTSPDVCTCKKGYKQFTLTRCIPDCRNCDHGVCIAPNICQCVSNYQKSTNGTCEPICENGCINGFCSAPNICSCNEGYYLLEEPKQTTIKCEPHCSKQCKNGYCSAPEQCACNNGYKMNSLNLCEPICENGCDNGICVGPNECICMPNFEYNSNGSCEPKCINNYKTYKNGEHVFCGCQEGFQLTESGNCEPYCTNCKNGFCQSPENCICNSGYKLVQNNTCEPICTDGCLNGFCIEPEICQCNDGFKLMEQFNSICQPICESCQNGICVAPNICHCLPNYAYVNGSCVPICYPECVNGDCLEPMKCTCKDGFEVDGLRRYFCHAMCDNCEYGYCNEPNVCRCYEGDEYNDDLKTCQLKTTFYNDLSTTPIENYWDNFDYDDSTTYDSISIENDLETYTTENYLTTDIENLDYDSTSDNSDIENFAYDSTSDTSDIENFHFDSTNYDSSTTTYTDYDSSTTIYTDSNSSTPTHTTENDLTPTDNFGLSTNCFNDECTCLKGYVFNNGICKPYCSLQCINSDCVEPDKCICWNGYTTLNSDLNHCLPICNLTSNGCKNGNCIAPHICECHENYELNPDNKFECINNDKLISLPYVIITILVLCVIIALGYLYYEKCWRTGSRKLSNDERGVTYDVCPEKVEMM